MKTTMTMHMIFDSLFEYSYSYVTFFPAEMILQLSNEFTIAPDEEDNWCLNLSP